MTLQLALYVLGLALAAVLSLGVAITAMRYSDRRGALYLGLAMLAIVEWSGAYILEATATMIPEKVFWSQVAYIGTHACTPLVLHFAAVLTNRESLLRPAWIRALIWTPPAVVVTLAFTNGYHHLIWDSFELTDVPNRILAYGRGPLYYLTIAYVYAVLIAASYLLLRGAYQQRRSHKRQAIAILLGLLPPWVTSAIYVATPSLLGYRDWIPVSFALSGPLLWWSLYNLQLLDVLPLARGRVVDEIQDGVIVLDQQGLVVDANPAVARLIGQHNILGRDAREIYAQSAGLVAGPAFDQPRPDHAGAFEQSQGEMTLTGGNVLEWRIAPVTPKSAGTGGYLVILTDITERRRSEQALQDLNAMLETQVSERTAEVRAQVERSEAILQSVSDGIVMADQQLQTRYINPAFTTLTGFSLDEVVGHHVESFLGLGLQSVTGPVEVAQRGGQMEARVSRKDGRFTEVLVTVSPMKASGGSCSGYVFTLHDVGQSRALDRARKGFLDNISHQLRTPVTTLRLYTHLLGRTDLAEDQRRSLDVIDSQVQSLQHLIEDILEVASLDSGNVITAWGDLQVEDIISTAMSRYEPRMAAAGLRFRKTDPSTTCPMLHGDAMRLAQALSEIMDNAVRFSLPDTEVTLTVKETHVAERTWVAIAVQNTGVPIPPEELPRAFERFHRGSAAEIGQLPGTGVGLSIAEAIVHAHGGYITLESEEGTTTLEMWLPVT